MQSKSEINLNAGIGVAIREYQTDVGPADYILFVDKKPVGELRLREKMRDYTYGVYMRHKQKSMPQRS